MCRMGKEVDKTHIAFCMETSTNSKTDVVLQGLLGRMCGYHNHTDILVYLHKKIVESGELERFVRWTHENTIIPKKANNLKTEARNVSLLYPIVPLKINNRDLTIDGSADVEPTSDNTSHIKVSVKAAIANGSFQDNNECPAQSAEIIQQVETYNTSQFKVKIIKKTDEGKKLAKKINDTFSSKIPGKLGSTNGIKADGGELLVLWFADAFPKYGIRKGDIFLDARTESCDENILAHNNKKEDVPLTTRREVFCRTLETGESVINNGSYTISMRSETSTSIETMTASLRELIGLSLQPSDLVDKPRKITSNQVAGSRWQGIIVNTYVFDGLKRNGSIYMAIEREFNVKIKVLKKSGPRSQELNNNMLIRLAEISW